MFGFKFIKFQPSEYVLMYKNGVVKKEGVGISFNYYAPTTSIVVVPVGSVDSPFMFEEVTNDFQTVSIQGQITYRIEDHKKTASLLNYTMNIKGRSNATNDAQNLPQRIINIARVLTKKQIENLKLGDAVRSSDILAGKIIGEIKANAEINKLGIEIIGLSILAISPNKETARALEAQAREEILKKADDALYERRNASIEQERRVKENELNTEIAIENKKRQIKETQLDTERALAQKENQLKEEQLQFMTTLEEQKKSLIELATENAKAEADAKAYELTVIMRALECTQPNVIQALTNVGMQPDKLIAIAFQNLAANAEKIGQLNITPDLLQGLLKGSDHDGQTN